MCTGTRPRSERSSPFNSSQFGNSQRQYRGVVDLRPFECADTPRSSLIQRVCYDKAQSYMLINLKGANYHHCELPPATFDAFMFAPSMGQFYNRNIKGSGADSPFDCRPHRGADLLIGRRGITSRQCSNLYHPPKAQLPMRRVPQVCSVVRSIAGEGP